MNPGLKALSLLLASVVPATAAHADAREIAPPRPVTLDLGPAVLSLAPTVSAQPETPAPSSATLDFGKEGSHWLTLGAGVAYDFSHATDAGPHVAYGVFIADNVELNLELAAFYHSQKGDDAGSINPQLIFRWHFYNDGDWTLYGDLGIGLMFSSDNVPDKGTGFNFTPRAGFGFTRKVSDGGVRLQVGLRWYHISNARIHGDARNPGRDAAMLYFGLIFPL